MTDTPHDPALDGALKLHQAGRIDRAARAYREILEQRPDHAHALHLLGVAELQLGHPDRAAELIARAIARQPNTGVFHLNHAAALRALRRIDDAIAEAEKAIVLDPRVAAEGYHVAALAFADGGQPDDAIDLWRQSLAARPDHVEARLSLAALMDSLGQHYFAVAEQIAAEDASRRRVEREPDDAAARVLLGRALELGGKADEAVAEYRAATRLRPHDATVFHALGRALARLRQTDEAIAALRFAVRMNPRLADAHAALGAALLSQARAAEATEALRQALSIRPHHPEARAALADALARAGEVEQAVDAARAAVADDPNSAAARSTLLRTLLLDWRATPHDLRREHAEWDRVHGAAMRSAVERYAAWQARVRATAPAGDAPPAPPPIDRNPDRPLRLGFVSPHFRRHPLAKSLIPLLEHLDRGAFSVTCYSDAAAAAAADAAAASDDDVTAEFKQLATQWRDTAARTDSQLALLVIEDRIDILIDLTGHGAGNRMLAFAQRPAPVQVTQLGYPFTTGLSAIAYRVSDEIVDPPDADREAERDETLVRLARPATCYRPWEPTPPRLEARGASEPITFGYLGDAAHLSPPAIQAWAALLSATPDARLMVMASTRDVDATRLRLARHGVEPFRLAVVAPEDGARYLDLYNRIDVALDSFPVSGGATAGDALWMARPVVTLAEPMARSRGAAVFLKSVGLDDLIASSPQQYVEIAATLARDRARLERLSQTLRETLARSPVCNARACAAAMAEAYRAAWRRWCASGELTG